MTPADVRGRARTAREFYQVAIERIEMAVPGPSEVAQVSAANAVQAAIAAADALCGRVYGYHASGDDHREAARLLRSLPGSGPRLEPRLRRLLADKTAFTYGGFCTRAAAERAAKDAAVLVAELDLVDL
jgi:hypothetical protein